MPTNPRAAITGQSGSTNTVPIYVLRMVSCYWFIATSSVRRSRFPDIPLAAIQWHRNPA